MFFCSGSGRSCVVDVGVEVMLSVPVRGVKGFDAMLANGLCSLFGGRSMMWAFSRWNDGVSLCGVWSLSDAGTAKHSEGARELLQAHDVFTGQIDAVAELPT